VSSEAMNEKGFVARRSKRYFSDSQASQADVRIFYMSYKDAAACGCRRPAASRSKAAHALH